MLATLFRTLGLTPDDETHHETETVRDIATALTSWSANATRPSRYANAARRRARSGLVAVSESERAIMEARLAAEADVSPDQAQHLVRLAVKATGSHGAAEDYQVAREFELLATREEKLNLLRALFTVSAQHGITAVEDNEISRIASVLRLERSDVTTLRHEFRDALNARQRRQ